MNFDEVKEIIDIFDKSSLNYMKLDIDNCHICMDKYENRTSGKDEANKNMILENSENAVTQIKEPILEVQKEDKKIEGEYITSPIVGTFYSSPSPDKESFVKVGDNIKNGDVICIIESMKLMNEIESNLEGKIAEVLVQNGDMVEFGQKLFRVI